MNNRYAPLPLFLTAAFFIVTAPIFWVGVEGPDRTPKTRSSEAADLYRHVCPSFSYGYGRLRAGEFPLWNDRQLCGIPFFADPRHGMLQPLNVPFLFLTTSRAMALHAFVALSLMGFFLVVFLRSMGVRYLPALVGGIVYAFCGASAAAMSRPACVNILVYMPILCWILRVYMGKPRPAMAIPGGLIFALLLLAGEPALVVSATLFVMGYGCVLIVYGTGSGGYVPELPDHEARMARARGAVTMGVIGLLLSAAQWVPTLAWALILENPTDFLGSIALGGDAPRTARELLAQFLPAATGTGPAMAYVGASTWLLVPAACFHAIPRRERLFFFVTACVATAGTLTAQATHGANPVISVAWLYPAVMSFSVLAALGADRLFQIRRDALSPRFWGPLLVILIVFAVMFVIAPAATRGRMMPVAAALLLFALFRRRHAGVLSAAIIVAFLFVDLSAASGNLREHPFFGRPNCSVFSREMAMRIRNTALDGRVLISVSASDTFAHANHGMVDNFRVANALGMPLTAEQSFWWRTLRTGTISPATDEDGVPLESRIHSGRLDVAADSPYAPLLNMMGARAVIVSDGGGLASGFAPGLRLRRVEDEGDLTLYANENALPRLLWAPAWRLALDLPAALDALCEPGFDPRRECVVAPSEPGISHLVRTVPDIRKSREDTTPIVDGPARIAFLVDHPERVIVEVENTMPGILILNDSYYPGWRASVDGQATPILQVNGLFRGMALPAGRHIVSFQYRPRSVVLGAAISLVTLIALAAWAVFQMVPTVRRLLNKRVS